MHTPDHSAFTEAQDQASLLEIAERIVRDGAKAALGSNFSDIEAREIHWRARDYISSVNDGFEDEDDFAGWIDAFYNPPSDRSLWALDDDFLRDERAEMSAWGMA